jgi:hypothetical protein
MWQLLVILTSISPSLSPLEGEKQRISEAFNENYHNSFKTITSKYIKTNNYGEVIRLVYATLISLNLDAFSYADKLHSREMWHTSNLEFSVSSVLSFKMTGS